MKSFVSFAAIVTIAAAPLAAAQSIICDYTKLAQAFPDAELDQCQSESGFDLFSNLAPTPTTLAKFCESDTCVGMWKAAVALDLPECSINGVDLVGEILEPIEAACKRNVNVRRLDGDTTKTTTAPNTTTTTPSSTTAKTPSTASTTPSTTTKTPSTASTTPNATTAAKTPSTTSASTTPSTTTKTPSTTPSAAKTPSTTPSATTKAPTATSGASSLTVAVGTVMAAVAAVLF